MICNILQKAFRLAVSFADDITMCALAVSLTNLTQLLNEDLHHL